ncbi:rCG22183 [Rattus norvegicus]|uniref:RCG22183 n=1 Tax=Rattus norvegicus TaxID=10116 RepID=A6INU4_RAT|nr:rCG22183 [Rattus norvegicus]
MMGAHGGRPRSPHCQLRNNK